MGYRVRLGKVNKSFKEKFTGITDITEAEQILDSMYPNSNSNALYRPEFHTELYELGKYVSYANDKNYFPFYEFDLPEEEFVIMTKEGLKELIESYRKTVHDAYESDYKDLTTLTDLAELALGLKRKADEWDNKFYCSIVATMDKEDTQDITASWYYEYSIFNLIHIYKTFDWENDYLIYNGW